jgi:hypothetical protein
VKDMNDRQRFKLLHGRYKPPRCRIGCKLFCELRGWVTVRGMSAGRIAWPRTKVKRAWAFILCGDLARAVRRESAIAICHWWGVTPQTLTVWRKALEVPPVNEGTRRLHVDYTPERLPPEVQEAARKKASSPEANAKKSAWRKGRPIHPNALAALERCRGQNPSKAARRKMSEAQKRRGAWPPAAGRPWSAEDECLLGTMPDAEVEKRTGRTLVAVRDRRYTLGIGRFRR